MTSTAPTASALAALPSENILKRRRMLFSRILMWPLFLLLLFTSSRWEGDPAVEAALFLSGCLLVAIASIGRLWCSLYICGYKTMSLVTEGPYSLCRNPLYFFSAIGATGVGLATETLAIPSAVILAFAAYYPFVIRGEEGKLLAIHGEPYRQYMREVPRFWPRLVRPVEPDTYLIVPGKIRRALVDSLWFVWLVGLLEFAEALRETGLVGTWWSLY